MGLAAPRLPSACAGAIPRRTEQEPAGSDHAPSLGRTGVSLPPPEPGVVDIAMVDYIFSPDVVEVTPGTVVRWTNLDAEPHDTVSYDAKWQSEYLETGGSFEYLFTDDSFQDFNYFCSLHGGMAGTVTVVAPEPAGLALLGWAILAALRRSRPTSAFLSPSCFCV